MGGEWLETTLGEAIEFQRGHDLPEQARKPGSVPVIGSAGPNGSHNEARARGPGVTIGRSGASAGVVTYVAEDYWPHNTCLYVTNFRGNDPRFCFYWLGTLDLAKYNSGSAQPSLNRNYTYGIRVWLPPPSEQHAIANLLGSLDDKIELNRRMAETLEGMARVIFKSWFVDFDPVRAKAEGRPTGLPDDLAALFPDRFGADRLPEGWTTEPFARLFEISGGNTPSTEDATFWGGPHQWATPKDLSALQSPVLLETARRLTDAGLQRCSSGLLPVGSLLLSSRAPIGYMAFVTQPTAINQGFAGIIKRRVSTTYAWAWCAANMDMITGNAGGSTFPEISKSVLRQLPMLAPPRPIIDAFAKIAEALVGRITASAQEALTLATLRDTLLPKLISGELRIADAEQRIAAA
jgi:type I restriction enzyme S subunit